MDILDMLDIGIDKGKGIDWYRQRYKTLPNFPAMPDPEPFTSCGVSMGCGDRGLAKYWRYKLQ